MWDPRWAEWTTHIALKYMYIRGLFSMKALKSFRQGMSSLGFCFASSICLPSHACWKSC